MKDIKKTKKLRKLKFDCSIKYLGLVDKEAKNIDSSSYLRKEMKVHLLG